MGKVTDIPVGDTSHDIPDDATDLVQIRKNMKDSKGCYRTESLFEDKARNTKYPAYFTLKDDDRKGCLSLKRQYLEIADPAEYNFAVKMFGDFKHWQVLCTRKWFIPHIEQWRLELNAKMESDAIEVFKKIAKDPKSKSQANAARTLIDRPWEKKVALRGRPSKAEVQGYKKQVAAESEESDADYERLFGENIDGK